MRSLREKLREIFIERFRWFIDGLCGLFQRALRNQKHSRYENKSKLKEP